MKKILCPALLLVLAARLTATAQLAGPPSIGLDFGSFSKLFGEVTAFSAKAEVQVFDSNQNEKNTTPFDLALLDNKVRVDINTGAVKSKEMPPMAVASMKQMGLDRIISLVRPDKKAIYIAVPGQKACVNMPMPKEDQDNFSKKPKIEKTAIGKETIDGHPCVKNKVVLTDESGGKHESTVWCATDLKDFPLRVLTKEKDDTVIVHLRQIQLAKPDAKQFDVPAGYQEYSDVQGMMQGIMMKMINAAGAPPSQ